MSANKKNSKVMESTFTLESSNLNSKPFNNDGTRRRSSVALGRRLGDELIPGESGVDKVGSWAEGFNQVSLYILYYMYIYMCLCIYVCVCMCVCSPCLKHVCVYTHIRIKHNTQHTTP